MSKCTNEMNETETKSAQANAKSAKKVPAEKPLSEGEGPPIFTLGGSLPPLVSNISSHTHSVAMYRTCDSVFGPNQLTLPSVQSRYRRRADGEVPGQSFRAGPRQAAPADDPPADQEAFGQGAPE
eukprot:3310019-Prymnesium_polylepis.1